MPELYKSLLSELKVSSETLRLPAMRVLGRWILSSNYDQNDVVNDLLGQAKRQDQGCYGALDALRASVPPQVMHVSSSEVLETVGWGYICAKAGSPEEASGLAEIDRVLRPWNDTMRGRIESSSASSGKVDAVRSWGRWSIADCYLAAYGFSLQYSLRRFKRSELLAERFPYVALFVDQLFDDFNFTRTLGTNAKEWRLDISTAAAKQACRRLGMGISDWGVPPPRWDSVPADVVILVAGSFFMPSLDRRGRVCPYACWAEGLMKKLGVKFLSVSADMFKKVDSLGQGWFKKIDPKAKSTPVARVNGQWLFDSKDIVKAMLDMQPRRLRDQIVIPSRPGVDPLVGPHGKELQTYCTIKWCAAPHGSKQEADMKAKTDDPLTIYENYLRAFGTPFFAGQHPGHDDFRFGNTLRNFKWFGKWCKGRNYFEDFPLLSAYCDRWESSPECVGLGPIDTFDLSFDMAFSWVVAFQGMKIVFCDLTGASVLPDEDFRDKPASAGAPSKAEDDDKEEEEEEEEDKILLLSGGVDCLPGSMLLGGQIVPVCSESAAGSVHDGDGVVF